MQVHITGQQFNISERLRRYVSTKLQRLERHFDHVTNVYVTLKPGRQSQCAEATVHVSGDNCTPTRPERGCMPPSTLSSTSWTGR